MNEGLKARISALLRKARADGASEAEAISAAERAARLMAEAGMTEDDIDYDEAQACLKTRSVTVRHKLWATIAICTNCAALTRNDWTPVIVFVGKAPGPQIAVYLTEMLNRALDREIETFKKTPEYKRRRTLVTRRAAVQDFLMGLVARLCIRLTALFAPSRSAEALADARAVLDSRFPGSVALPMKARPVRFGAAASAGYAVGGRVQIARGVNAGAPIQRIGGAS